MTASIDIPCCRDIVSANHCCTIKKNMRIDLTTMTCYTKWLNLLNFIYLCLNSNGLLVTYNAVQYTAQNTVFVFGYRSTEYFYSLYLLETQIFSGNFDSSSKMKHALFDQLMKKSNNLIMIDSLFHTFSL